MRFLVGLILLLATFIGEAKADVLKIENAILLAQGTERSVTLPNRLSPNDFDPDGSIVTYRITFSLPTTPEGLQAIYVSKLSLSGRLVRAGKIVWSCGNNKLSELRCLHRPHLIQLPEGFLHAGRNVLDFEIYADQRQMNGLTPVYVGDFNTLSSDYYALTRFLKTDLIRILAIFAGVAGLLSLAAWAAAPGERLFLMFGIASIAEALASYIVLVVDPLGDRAFASWLVFIARYITVPLKLLMFFEAFGKLTLKDHQVKFFIFMLLIGPPIIALTDASRISVIFLYFFVFAGILIVFIRMMIWTRAKPTLHNILWTAAAAIITICGFFDYLRLGGAVSFDGVYLLYYAFPLLMILTATIMFARMGVGLRVAQEFSTVLQHEVAKRTEELESAVTSIRNMEDSALRLTRNLPIGTFIVHASPKAEPRCIFVSDRLRYMLALPLREDVPSFADLLSRVHPADAQSARDALTNPTASARQIELELRTTTAADNHRWLRVIMLPQSGSASPTIWDGVVTDVTDARQAEERLHAANLGLIEAAAQQSRVDERERLLQDMHDGFGSQLSSARLAVEQGGLDSETVARILLECSEDLRIMVDALSNEDGNIANAIADFRYRIDRRLLSAEMSIKWDITIAEELRLPPAVILQVLRVLQEAVSNALRHSGATLLTVKVHAGDGDLTASVTDNGRGFADSIPKGRGIANMRKRCREIGAQFSQTSDDKGTTVLLSMELSDAS